LKNVPGKNHVTISFKSNPRTRSNSKKGKRSTVHSNNKSIEHDVLNIKSIISIPNKSKLLTKKKIKRSKLSTTKNKKKAKSEIKSESSSIKRKNKNLSTSPRNNIEDLMQQFLVMKHQNTQGNVIPKYLKENIITPDFSKEQTKSILNISSQGGTNMSFINYKILSNDQRPKSKESK